MSVTKWKMFFDIACPNSWISFKLLNSGRIPNLMNAVDFIPICDVKLYLIRSYQSRLERRWKRKDQDETTITILGNLDMFTKKLQTAESDVIPNDWEEVYSTMIRYGTITPAILLSSIKKHFPEHFLRSVEIVGERIWERKQLVHKGAHLFQCSREAGLCFKDSDEIISRLSHVDSRQLLHENSQEALQLGASSAPFFASSSGEPTVTFSDFHDFKNFVIDSELLDYISRC